MIVYVVYEFITPAAALVVRDKCHANREHCHESCRTFGIKLIYHVQLHIFNQPIPTFQTLSRWTDRAMSETILR